MSTGPEDEDRSPQESSAQPFEAAPRQLPAPGQSCSRMALAGCAVMLLLIGLGVLTLMLKARDVVSWSLDRVRVEIERTLPADFPATDRARMAAAFDAVDVRLSEGDLDAVAFQGLQVELLEVARLGRAPTPEEIADLSLALEEFAGSAATDEGREEDDP